MKMTNKCKDILLFVSMSLVYKLGTNTCKIKLLRILWVVRKSRSEKKKPKWTSRPFCQNKNYNSYLCCELIYKINLVFANPKFDNITVIYECKNDDKLWPKLILISFTFNVVALLYQKILCCTSAYCAEAWGKIIYNNKKYSFHINGWDSSFPLINVINMKYL